MTRFEFEKKYMYSLNEQQSEAVRTPNGAVLLLAVPGSGKTTVLVTRLGYMTCVEGIPPQNILTMTYTVAATREMRDRFAALFGTEYADGIEFRTINGIAQLIIDHYGSTCSRREPFAIIDDDAVITRIIRNAFTGLNGEYPDDSTVRDIRTSIGYVKNMMLTGAEIEQYPAPCDDFPEIFRQYNDALKSMCRMDFDDQLLYARTVLRSRPQVLAHFQDRFRYICVDEAQDTSKLQHDIIRLLASADRNIFMVGDEDQSIYGFRAAYPEALMTFAEDYPGARIMYLEHNYRSRPEIIAAANRFVSGSAGRYEKYALPVRQEGGKVEQVIFSQRSAQFVFARDIARKSGSETAFLYRNNDTAIPLIDLLDRRGIPYSCRRFDDSFFTDRTVADVRDIVFFAKDRSDAAAFMRIYYKMGLGITKREAADAADESLRTGGDILRILSQTPRLNPRVRDGALNLSMHLSKLLQDSAETGLVRICGAIGYEKFLRSRRPDDGKLQILRILAKNEKNMLSLFERLDVLQKRISENGCDGKDAVTLSTIHSAKGLEFERVYLLDVCDGILPAVSGADTKTEDEKKTYAEERRLFYVGMTRAKDELYICRFGDSEFADEIFPPVRRTYEDVVRKKKGPV